MHACVRVCVTYLCSCYLKDVLTDMNRRRLLTSEGPENWTARARDTLDARRVW
jgi:hypothetical protein